MKNVNLSLSKTLKSSNKVLGKHIVIGVTGSIAAYKAAEITSQLKQKGYEIYVIMTKNAMEFVGPATFRSLTGNIVLTEMFPKDNTFTPLEVSSRGMAVTVSSRDGGLLTGFSPTLHISLAEWMDVLVIVPATANIIGKIAHGVADDLLSTTALSTQKPILIAPAMNEKMYINFAVQENLKMLKKRNYKIIEPETGFLACGYTGKGRLAATDKIISEIEKTIK